jgi:Spy/CpxP family protein refolding chaperone
MPISERKLRELVDLTREMLDASRGGDWQSVSLLEEQRQAILAAKDLGPLAGSESLRIRLQEMIAANAEILRAAVLAREQVRHELEEVARGSRAVAAYATNR